MRTVLFSVVFLAAMVVGFLLSFLIPEPNETRNLRDEIELLNAKYTMLEQDYELARFELFKEKNRNGLIKAVMAAQKSSLRKVGGIDLDAGKDRTKGHYTKDQ